MSRKTRFALARLALSFLVSGAPVLAEDAAESPLAGTEWRLVEFQSMSDSVGTVRPDDPSLYTMRLGEDGTVRMRLNCNRATGTWTAEPAASGRSGGFEFEDLAATQALCPRPSMDEKIVKDAEYVRSYLLRGGRLYLSLMADAGIYAWEPAADIATDCEFLAFSSGRGLGTSGFDLGWSRRYREACSEAPCSLTPPRPSSPRTP